MSSVSCPRGLLYGAERSRPGNETQQVIAASNLVTIAEAVSLAERSGVIHRRCQSTRGGFADYSPSDIRPRFAKRQYEPFLGHVYTMMKDLDTARDLGQEKGLRS